MGLGLAPYLCAVRGLHEVEHDAEKRRGPA